MTTLTQHLLKSGLYLAAILLLPGALIGAPLLWWLGHRNARRTTQQPDRAVEAIDGHCANCP